MKLKRIVSIILILFILVSFSACGASAENVFQALDDISDLLNTDINSSSDPAQQEPVQENLNDGSSDIELINKNDSSETNDNINEESENENNVIPDREGWYYDLSSVVMYLETYGSLPSNYITKNEAESLGWSGGSIQIFKDGAAIGGNRFGNYEGLLPNSSGRSWTECDIDTNGATSRGSKRLVFSNDGLYYYTDDHYETFHEVIYANGEVIIK